MPRSKHATSLAVRDLDDGLDMDKIVQRRTSVATTGVQKPAGAANSVFDVAKPAKRQRVVPPPIDAAAIKIHRDVPLPPALTGVGAVNTIAYRALLARMKAGDSVDLPERQARGLQSLAKKDGVRVALRKSTDGRLGLWRLK